MASMASTAFAGTRVQVARRVTVRARPRFVVKASVHSDRRKVLGTLLAGAAILPAAAFSAVTPMGGGQQTRQQQQQQMREQQQRGPFGQEQPGQIDVRGGQAQVPSLQRRGQEEQGRQQQQQRGPLGQEQRGQIDVQAGQAQVPASQRRGKEQQQQQQGFFGQQQRGGQVESQVRGGQAQVPASLRDSRDRVNNWGRRLEQEVFQNLQRGNWDASRDNLRDQVASLGQDMKDLVNAAPDARRAQERNRAFNESIDRLQVAIRQKDKDEAMRQYDSAIEQLGNTISALG